MGSMFAAAAIWHDGTDMVVFADNERGRQWAFTMAGVESFTRNDVLAGFIAEAKTMDPDTINHPGDPIFVLPIQPHIATTPPRMFGACGDFANMLRESGAQPRFQVEGEEKDIMDRAIDDFNEQMKERYGNE